MLNTVCSVELLDSFPYVPSRFSSRYDPLWRAALDCYEAGSNGKMAEHLLPARHVVESCVSGCGVDYCSEIRIDLNGLRYYRPAYVGLEGYCDLVSMRGARVRFRARLAVSTSGAGMRR